MAWAYVNGATTNTGANMSMSVTAGELLVTAVFDGGGSGTTLGLGDGGVNTWTKIDSFNDVTNGNSLAWWWAIAATTTTLTIAPSGGSGTYNILGARYTGNAASSPLSTHSVNPSSGTAPATGSSSANADTGTAITPGVDGCLIVSWIMDDAALGTGSIWTAGNSPNAFTKRANSSQDIASAIAHAIEDFVQTTAASITATWTCSKTDSYICFTASFKPPASALTTEYVGPIYETSRGSVMIGRHYA